METPNFLWKRPHKPLSFHQLESPVRRRASNPVR